MAADDGCWLSHDKYKRVKEFVVAELETLGCVIPAKWDHVNVLWETVKFMYNGALYGVFVSCRKNNCVRFGVFKYPGLESLFNETFFFEEHRTEIVRLIGGALRK
jgi:hypothetical protein